MVDIETPPGAPSAAGQDAPASSGRSLEELKRAASSRALPVLPIRDTVLFPQGVASLTVAQEGVSLVDDAMNADRLLVIVAQRNFDKEEPSFADLHHVGTLALIARMARVGEDRTHVVVRGLARVELLAVETEAPYMKCTIGILEEQEAADVETNGLAKAAQDQFAQVVALSDEMPSELEGVARRLRPVSAMVDFVAGVSELPVQEKQALLEELVVKERLKLLTGSFARKLEVLEMGRRIREQVRGNVDEEQRQFFLRQQLKAIQKELGETDETDREIEELKARLDKAELPAAARSEADRELRRLALIPLQSPEHTVVRAYLEWLSDMPWAVETDDNLDLHHARAILDEDHYGLDKIKERILEYLAVRRFKPDAKTPILCFVGPPGTGKTSLGRSIARALGRKFVRHSLGGVRDEAEIRGHRRTYLGALPGSIVQNIRRAGSRNPLFVLDEVDKLGADFRGDPASALLEVLDPEQNSTFVDHYLDVPFDLSRVLFVCTANLLDPVPPALRDRMEVIALSGYTEHEKVDIAKRYLLPKAIRESGLETLGLTITDEGLRKVIREYTSEAGLRNLQREIEALLRRTAKAIAEGDDAPRTIDPARVRELLGPERFTFERVRVLEDPGLALGLAWTPAGGELLVIEATAMPGSDKVILTGKLGDVMKESAQAALSYARSHAVSFGIDPDLFARTDVHVHIPAGAIAKDGPSAGVALCAALVSALSGRRAVPETAMTGEITLRGRVLRVGGIKEKVLAAHRAGIRRVVLPNENVQDLEDVPEEVRNELEFIAVEHMEQTLERVLEPKVVGRDGSGQEREMGAAGQQMPARA